MMPHFPMFVDLKGKSALIVGGGKVAWRKLEKLAPFGVVATVGRHNVKMEILLIKATYTLWSLASWSAPIYCLYLLTYTCKLFFSN
jgi:hypothetical protein